MRAAEQSCGFIARAHSVAVLEMRACGFLFERCPSHLRFLRRHSVSVP